MRLLSALVRFSGRVAEHGAIFGGFDLLKHSIHSFTELYGKDARHWPVWACAIVVLILIATGAIIYRLTLYWREKLQTEEGALSDNRVAAAPNADNTRHPHSAALGALVCAVAGLAIGSALTLATTPLSDRMRQRQQPVKVDSD